VAKIAEILKADTFLSRDCHYPLQTLLKSGLPLPNQRKIVEF